MSEEDFEILFESLWRRSFLQETIEFLAENGKCLDDVVYFVTGYKHDGILITADNFINLAANTYNWRDIDELKIIGDGWIAVTISGRDEHCWWDFFKTDYSSDTVKSVEKFES